MNRETFPADMFQPTMNTRTPSHAVTFLIFVLHTALSAAAEPAVRPPFQYKSEGIKVPAATADEPKVPAFGPESLRAAR